jgi:hypothetical protein
MADSAFRFQFLVQAGDYSLLHNAQAHCRAQPVTYTSRTKADSQGELDMEFFKVLFLIHYFSFYM